MKLFKELVRIFSICAICRAGFRDDNKKFLIFTGLILFVVYIYPSIVAFIAKIFGVGKSHVGYSGEIRIRKPNASSERGQIAFKMFVEPEQLYYKDDALFMIKREYK